MTSERHLLWIIDGDEGYGVRRATLGLATCLCKLGFTFTFVATRTGPFLDELRSAGYTVVSLGRERVRGLEQRGFAYLVALAHLVTDSFSTGLRLLQEVRRQRPRWIHVHANRHLLAAALAGRSTGTPVFWHLHNSIRAKLPWGLQAASYRSICRLCRVVPIANSRHTATTLTRQPSRVQVVHPGVDSSHFSPDAAFPHLHHHVLGLDPNVPTLLIAARVVPDKAQDRVVDAVIALLSSGMQLSLLIVGGPVTSPYYHSLLRKVRTAGVDHFIRFLGPTHDPRPYYRLSDFVVNSRLGAEPYGLTIVEAMLMQRPVLAYAAGGPSETIEDGRTGWLIQSPSVTAYQEGINRALAARSEWAEMGCYARDRALRLFSLQESARAYAAILEQAPPRRARP